MKTKFVLFLMMVILTSAFLACKKSNPSGNNSITYTDFTQNNKVTTITFDDITCGYDSTTFVWNGAYGGYSLTGVPATNSNFSNVGQQLTVTFPGLKKLPSNGTYAIQYPPNNSGSSGFMVGLQGVTSSGANSNLGYVVFVKGSLTVSGKSVSFSNLIAYNGPDINGHFSAIDSVGKLSGTITCN
jgi:hypothetical protein